VNPKPTDRLPFTEVLGIPVAECPPNHYQLLGLRPLESDANLIRDAVTQKLSAIESGNFGQDGESVTQYVRMVASVLENQELKEVYDSTYYSKTLVANKSNNDSTSQESPEASARPKILSANEMLPGPVRLASKKKTPVNLMTYLVWGGFITIAILSHIALSSFLLSYLPSN